MAFRAFISVDFGSLPGLLDLHEELDRTDAALKLVDPNQYHMTLKFLGDVAVDRIPEIVDAMRSAAEGVDAFDARFHGVGAFPSEDFIKVVWAGMAGAGALSGIVESLEEDLGHIRSEDHDFHPHVTLARMQGGRGKERVQAFLADRADEPLDEVSIERIRLKRSELTPEGPVYETVEEVPL